MMKWSPSITIYQVELLENGAECSEVPFDSWYFLTYKGAKRFVKVHEKEWADLSWRWRIGGEPLFLF